MSSKTTGDPRKKGGVNRPTPSVSNKNVKQARPAKSSSGGRTAEISGTKAASKRKATLRKSPVESRQYERGKKKPQNTRAAGTSSSISIDRNNDYRDSFSNPDMMDRSAEEILRKPQQRESTLHYQKPLPAAKAPSSPYKRKVKRVLFYAATLLLVVSVCIVLSLTVFFKIDEITVEGETRYKTEDIIASCMIEQGDNLILCRTSPGESNIWQKFPYIESVSIRKKLFNGIVISVEEAVPSTVIESGGKYVILSESGKIIDITDKKQEDIPMILGAKLQTPKLSSSVRYKDENMEEYINEILTCADKYGFGTLKIIDISNLSKIVLEHKKGLHIIIGTPDNIDHKLKTARKVIDKGVSESDTGTLDVSLSASDGGKSYFNSQKTTLEQPSKPESSGSVEVSGQSSETQSSEGSDDSSVEFSDENENL